MPERNEQPPLILASTSPYRREMLERLGLPFRCVSPSFDEDDLKGGGLHPRALAEALAEGKARAVAESEPNAVVIGGDQLVVFDSRIFGKPGDAAGAVAQLQTMAGRTHELVTALVVLAPGRREAHVDVTRLTMRSLTLPAVERYVARDEPFDCAGGYKLEQGGIALFERIESEDHSAIVGLPLLALTRILAGFGFSTP